MRYHSALYLIVALLVGLLGFGAIAETATWIASLLFLLFVTAS
jgi:uncharacterized membrane protein YtjA (UPF0391 family)